MKKLLIALAAAALAAAAFFLTPRSHRAGAPQLLFVTPQPNANLMVARAPVSLHLAGGDPKGEYALLLDGRLAQFGGVAPVVRYLPSQPLGTGRHVLTAYVFGNRYAWQYSWRFSVARGAQRAVKAWGRGSEQALADVNYYRALAGERPLRLDLALEGASRAHSRFFYRNLERYGATLNISVHQEQPGWPGYVGRNPYARDVAFGFNGDGDSEVMAFGVPIGNAVKLWIDSVYHRFGLLDPGLVEMGYGISGSARQDQDLPVTTIDAGYLASAEVPDRQPVLWPGRGLVGVPLAFLEGEIPDPLANFPGAAYPAGYPVTISFFGEQVSGLRVASAQLRAHGKVVPSYVLAPANEQNPDELGMSAALIPRGPLSENTVYSAEFGGSYRDPGGWHAFHYGWSFSTQAPPQLGRTVGLRIGSGPTVAGRAAQGDVYVPARSLLSAAGGTLVWSGAHQDAATALLGGHRLAFSRMSFYATLDGRSVTLGHVPVGGGPNPSVPAKEFLRLLGLRATLAVVNAQRS